MDPISWCIIGGIAVATAATTYFVARHASNSDDSALHENINNQILIEKEKDCAHEFAQTLILIIILILLCIIIAYWGLKCMVRAVQRQFQQNLNTNNNQNQHQIVV